MSGTREHVSYYVEHMRFGWRDFGGATVEEAKQYIAEWLQGHNAAGGTNYRETIGEARHFRILRVTRTTTTEVLDHNGRPTPSPESR